MAAAGLAGDLPIHVTELERRVLDMDVLGTWFGLVDGFCAEMASARAGTFTGDLAVGRRVRPIAGTVAIGPSGRTLRLTGECGYRSFAAHLTVAQWWDGARFLLALDIDGVSGRRLHRMGRDTFARLLGDLALHDARIRVPGHRRRHRDLTVRAIPTSRIRSVDPRPVPTGSGPLQPTA